MTLFRLVTVAVTVCIAAACGGYSAPTGSSAANSPPPSPNPTSDVTIRVGASTLGTQAFDPNPKNVSLAAGADVRWINGDITGGDYTMGTATQHTIVADDGGFSSTPLKGNDTFSHTFAAAGDYSYHCGIHPTMKGTIHVTP